MKKRRQTAKPTASRMNREGLTVQDTEPDASSSTSIFLADIRDIPLLTKEETEQLGRQIQTGKLAQEQMELYATELDEKAKEELQALCDAGEQAAKTLARHNLRLVVYYARKYAGRGLSFEDIIQEGSVALTKAAKNYNPDKGAAFGTYAKRWIEPQIQQAINEEKSGQIQLPRKQMLKYADIEKGREALAAIGNDNPTPEQIAEATHIPVATVKRVQRTWRETRTIAASHIIDDPDEEYDPLDLAAGADPDAVMSDLDRKAAKVVLLRVMQEVLTPLEEACMVLKFGFEDNVPREDTVVGKELGLTRWGVATICKRATQKMREFNEQKNYCTAFWENA